MSSPIDRKSPVLVLLLIAFAGGLGWALSLLAKSMAFWSLIFFGVVVIAITITASWAWDDHERRRPRP